MAANWSVGMESSPLPFLTVRDDLEPLLSAAASMVSLADDQLKKAGAAEPVDREQLPDALLAESAITARLHFQGALVLLEEPVVSVSCDLQARALLEVVTYLEFVLGGAMPVSVGTAPQRAACVALARAVEAHAAQAAAANGDPATIPPDNVAAAQARVNFYLNVHTNLGCAASAVAVWPCKHYDASACRYEKNWPCRGPRIARRIVGPVLAHLADQDPELKWLRSWYSASSLTVHQVLVDGLLGDGTDGTSYIRAATLDERQQMLSRISFIYARFVKLHLSHYSSAVANEFMQRADQRFANVGVRGSECTIMLALSNFPPGLE